MAALSGQEPDRVPYCELAIDRAFAAKLLGWDERPNVNALEESTPFTIAEARKVSTMLGLDNLFYLRRQPVYVDTFVDEEGRIFPASGKIKTEDDLAMINLPDPHRDEFYAEAESFAKNRPYNLSILHNNLPAFNGVFNFFESLG